METANLTPLQRKLMGLPPRDGDTPPASTDDAPPVDPSLDGDGINAADAPPTETPTDEQVAEAAKLLQLADTELRALAPDRHVVGILRRLGLPDNDATVAAVKAAARDGAEPHMPVNNEPPSSAARQSAAPAAGSAGEDDESTSTGAASSSPASSDAAGPGGEAGEAQGSAQPASGEPPGSASGDGDSLTPNQKAALGIAEHMRNTSLGSMPVKKAKKLARQHGGIKQIRAKRWETIVRVGESMGLFTQIGGKKEPVQLPPLHVKRLQELGFDVGQIARMQPAERRRCIDGGLTDVGRSVLPDGRVIDVGPVDDVPRTDAELTAAGYPNDDELIAAENDEKPHAKPTDSEPGTATSAPPVPELPPPPGQTATQAAKAKLDEYAPPSDLPARAAAVASTIAADAIDANRPAIPHRCVIFVGALPVGVKVDTDFAHFIAPLVDRVNTRFDIDGKPVADPARAVGHYGLVSYGKGPKLVASQLSAFLHQCEQQGKPMAGTMFVDPSHPCASDCLPVLANVPGVLVVRAVR